MFSLPIVEDVVGFILWAMTVGGLAALFLLATVEGFGIPPLPSEVILPFAGYLVYTGTYAPVPAGLLALAGEVTGCGLGYLLGRYGRRLVTTGPRFLRLAPEHLAAMDDWFRRHGEGAVLFTRLTPLVRSYASYPAGAARMSPARFGAYTAVGSAPYIAALMYAGYALGPHWSVLESYFHDLDYVALAGIVLLVGYLAVHWTRRRGARAGPRLTPSTGSPPPAEAATPSATGPRSPPA